MGVGNRQEFLGVVANALAPSASSGLMKDCAAKRGIVYVDCHTPMSDEKHAMKKEYSRDGVHPQADGYAVMAPFVDVGITQALKRIRKGTAVPNKT